MECVYNGFVLIFEILVLLVRMIVEIVIATVRKIIPSTEQPVDDETILVSNGKRFFRKTEFPRRSFQITGAGHGIGRELALQYAALGATIVCWDLNRETNEQTAREIKSKGGRAFAYQCDVTSREQVLQLAEKVQREVGNVTVLVNNAGIMPCHPFREQTEKEIRMVFEINVMAHFWVRTVGRPVERESFPV